MYMDAVVDDRALREIYASRSLKIQTLTVCATIGSMAFNSEHDWLLNQVLRQRFDGGNDGAANDDRAAWRRVRCPVAALTTRGGPGSDSRHVDEALLNQPSRAT